MNRIMNIGVIGLGFMGKKHMECYMKMDNVNLAAAADANIDSYKLVDNHNYRLYKTLDEMLEKEKLDAVDICLPTVFHKEAVIKALNSGVNVIVEKPFALETDEIDEMIETSKNNNKRLMVAHVCRFMNEYKYAKEVIDNEVLGKPLFYYGCRNSSTPRWSANNWLADKRFSGGTVMDLQIHDIDVANWFFGDSLEYKMIEINNPAMGTENFGHIVSTIKYNNNKTAVLEAGHLMPNVYPFTTSYRLICEKGVLEFFKGFDSIVKLIMYKENETVDMTEDYKTRFGDCDPYLEELKHFVGCIINGEEFAISALEAKEAVRVVNKLTENIF